MPKGVYVRKSFTKEHRKNIGKGQAGRKHSAEHIEKFKNSLPNRQGKNHPQWKGGRVKTQRGYILVYKPDHPYGESGCYIREHRLIMEKILGRYLKPSEEVHHINGKVDDNRPENLIVVEKNNHKKDYASAYRDGHRVGFAKAMVLFLAIKGLRGK